MSDNENCALPYKRTPWNKGKLIGARPPLRPKHVWSIRTRLLLEGRIRDLALFNLAIDSKLRSCDVVAVRVEDVAPNGYTMERATVRQKKTGRPVKFDLTDQTRQAIDDYLKAAVKKPGEFLFAVGAAPATACPARPLRAETGQQRTESSDGRAADAVTPPSPDGGTFVARRDRIGGEARWFITWMRRRGIFLRCHESASARHG